jgi:hypothetical protein
MFSERNTRSILSYEGITFFSKWEEGYLPLIFKNEHEPGIFILLF